MKAVDRPSGASTLEAVFPGFGDGAPLELPSHLAASALSRLLDGTHDDFADTLAGVGNCVHPIRLTGSTMTIDRSTGEVLSSWSSEQAPLGALYRPCGNRRAEVCPACSRTYARDTFAMIRAGVAGGKTIPTTVAANPLLFVTLTAPSFGLVHAVRDDNRPCRPRSSDRSRRSSLCRRLPPGILSLKILDTITQVSCEALNEVTSCLTNAAGWSKQGTGDDYGGVSPIASCQPEGAPGVQREVAPATDYQ